MTTEEEIKALHLTEHVESISTIYEPGEVRNDTTVRELKEACRMAITALRAQQAPVKLDRSLWKGCKTCKDPSMSIWIGHMYQYCPYCGKPLTEEAWAELEQRIGGNDGKTDAH